MGTSYSSYAIIGVEVDPEKFYTTEVVRSCDCHVSFNFDDPPKFCSNCSKEFMVKDRKEIEGWNEFEEILHGLKIIYGTDQERAFVGIVNAKQNDYDNSKSFSQLSSVDLAELKEELKNKLGPMFWDENKFGLYSVLYCSY